jgi:ribonuclease P protein subunit POP4
MDDKNSYYTPTIAPIDRGFAEVYTNELLTKDQLPKVQYDKKLKDKILNLDQQPKNKHLKPIKSKILSIKKRKEKQLVSIINTKYDFFIPLNLLWISYIEKQLDRVNGEQFCTLLLKADLHGSIITITKSKCPSNVGLTGIVVRDTENTFQVVTRNDKLKILPKKDSWFFLRVGDKLVTIYGNHFVQRPEERVTKKYKTKPTVALE